MRRAQPKGTPRPSSIIGDIKTELPQSQLAAIGALALAFNEVEANLDRLFTIVSELPEHLVIEVITRINGIPGIIEVISKGSEKILEKGDWEQLTEAMGNGWFGNLKSYRDCVIHARHINPATWIGVKVDRQAHVFDVLLSSQALNAAYDRLAVLRKELDEAAAAIGGLLKLRTTAADDPNKAPLEAKIAESLAQFRRHRTERQSLPPIPEFPTESELRVLGFQAQQAQTAIVGRWYLDQADTPLALRRPGHVPLQNVSWVPRPPDPPPNAGSMCCGCW